MPKSNKTTSTKTLPLLALRGLVVFPGTIIHFDVGRTKSLNALHRAMENDQTIFLVTQKDPTIEYFLIDDCYSVGVVARVLQIMKLPDDKFRIVAEGLYSADIKAIVENDPCYVVKTEKRATRKITNIDKETALERALRMEFEDYADKSPIVSSEAVLAVKKSDNLSDLCNCISDCMPFSNTEKQELLEMITISRKAEKLLKLLNQEQKILEIELDIQKKVQTKIDDNQKEFYLREQMHVISEELGEEDNPHEEAQEYISKIHAISLNEEVEEKLIGECKKLSKMPFGSHEASVIRTYLDTCVSLPWNKYTEDSKDIQNARELLEKSHYGLTDVKERILELIAVRNLSEDFHGQIICLVGPPGVGKTSIAHSIAEAMNREYVRVSLGGVHDEADIRGHRRTYIGAMMGRIMDAVKKAGCSNPLVLLDEIDKLSHDYHGDPASALLEVLDPEQNCHFVDHYLDVPFDLSKALFMTTANEMDSIPAPLLDRMDIIRIEGYTEHQKLQIAKQFLVRKQLKANGLTAKQFSLSEATIKALMKGYTREAGVRSLEKYIGKLCRKVALSIVEKGKLLKVSTSNLEELLGPAPYKDSFANAENEIGVVNGLAWTSAGGELLPIEVSILEGTGKIELTGSLGDVMKESAKVAVSYARSHASEYSISEDFYKTKDIHIHAPEGAVPKEGPSAGITIATAVISALSKQKVRHDIAMTGELSLRGKVLPIGGLKEKSMAAYTHHIKNIIVPKDNKPDAAKIDKEVLDAMSITYVSSLKEVLDIALE